MVRRMVIGTLSAAALLGASVAMGTSGAQAQGGGSSWACNGSFGGSAACGEIRFNQAPDPRDAQPQIQLASQAQAPQGGAQASSQAGPRAESQPSAEE